MKRIPRHTLIPILLLCYLGAMAYIGWPDYAAGRTTALYYFGIILLHFILKKRDRLRLEREDDIRRNSKP